jgi:hypothetical protein
MNPIFRFSRHLDGNQVRRPRSVDPGRRRSGRGQPPLLWSEFCKQQIGTDEGKGPHAAPASVRGTIRLVAP